MPRWGRSCADRPCVGKGEARAADAGHSAVSPWGLGGLGSDQGKGYIHSVASQPTGSRSGCHHGVRKRNAYASADVCGVPARPHRVSGLIGLVRSRAIRRILGLVILGSRALSMISTSTSMQQPFCHGPAPSASDSILVDLGMSAAQNCSACAAAPSSTQCVARLWLIDSNQAILGHCLTATVCRLARFPASGHVHAAGAPVEEAAAKQLGAAGMCHGDGTPCDVQASSLRSCARCPSSWPRSAPEYVTERSFKYIHTSVRQGMTTLAALECSQLPGGHMS